MEQNGYSFRAIMEEWYLETLINQNGIDYDKLHGKTVKDRIIEVENSIKRIPDRDNFIRQETDKLYKMLNVVLKDCTKVLCKKPRDEKSHKHSYSFNDDNKMFFFFLLEIYDNRDDHSVPAYLKRQFDDVDDDMLDIIHMGFLNLAKNENTLLTVEEFENIWNHLRWKKYCSNPYYKEMIDLVENLRSTIIFFFETVPNKEEYRAGFEAVKEILILCDDAIHSIGNTMGWQDMSDGLTPDELKRIIDDNLVKTRERIIKRQERSERAIKGWKKRKGSDSSI